MKYHGKDIKDFWDTELLILYNDLSKMEAKRKKASNHEKFKKIAFVPTNPIFVELKTEIENEIRKRKLMDI